jgi:hypothetical protein
MPQRNLAVELLQKLLAGEIRSRSKKNVVQSRSFAELLEQSLRRYQNRAIETAQVIEELIALANDMRNAHARGQMGTFEYSSTADSGSLTFTFRAYVGPALQECLVGQGSTSVAVGPTTATGMLLVNRTTTITSCQ